MVDQNYMMGVSRRQFIRDHIGVLAVGTGILITGCLGENRTPGLVVTNWDSVERTVTVTISDESDETVIDKRVTLSPDEDIYYENVFPGRGDSVTYQAEVSVDGGIIKTRSFDAGNSTEFHDLQIYIESAQTVEIAPVVR